MFGGGDLFSILLDLRDLIELTFPVIIGLAILFFLWGLAKYMLQTDSPEGRTSARSIMIWGVIIIFVMVSLWGLVAFIGDTLGIYDTGAPNPPQIPI